MASKKLAYTATKVAVKQSDKITLPELGEVSIENIHAPRKKNGSGRVTLKLADGRLLDYPPAVINASWM